MKHRKRHSITDPAPTQQDQEAEGRRHENCQPKHVAPISSALNQIKEAIANAQLIREGHILK